VIPILGGLGAALSWGFSTVVASRSTRLIGSQQALAYVMLLGLGGLVVLAPASGYPSHAPGHAWAWAALAGAGSAAGLSMMYRALRLGKVGVVAPIASTEGALAAVFSIALGETLTVAVAACLVVIACGVVVVTMRGRTADVHLRPSLYALCAACLFGINLVASARAGDALGALWTILVARIVGVAVIAVPLLLRRRLQLPGAAWWMVAFSAVAELVGYVSFVTGAHHGVAIPAVLASQFAAVATITSFAIFGERIGPRQIAGAAVIVAGVSVLAVLRA
jgi:drug/metabolite transporter (DMT)-like permease